MQYRSEQVLSCEDDLKDGYVLGVFGAINGSVNRFFLHLVSVMYISHSAHHGTIKMTLSRGEGSACLQDLDHFLVDRLQLY